MLLLSSGCSATTADQTSPQYNNTNVTGNVETRPFYLGFTPFLYNLTPEAFTYTYTKIAEDADLICQHFDSGIPWVEALAGLPYDASITDEWELRRAATPPWHKVYVAITPISDMRDGLAPYRDTGHNMPLPSPWDTYDFNHPDVKTAFLNFAVDVIEFFEPDYFAMSIEANLLMAINPDEWDAYMELHRYVYGELKQMYPDLPVFTSFSGTFLLEGYHDNVDHESQMKAFDDVIEHTDYYALSIYTYLTRFLCDGTPSTVYDNLFSLSDKPIAITETAYPAETFSRMNGTVTYDTSPQEQNAFVDEFLDVIEERDVIFVVYFVLRDFDDYYEFVGGSDLMLLWRDTELYDGEGNPRPALNTWLETLARPHDE